MQIITHFVKFKPKYKLEKNSKFKFNKGTIATPTKTKSPHQQKDSWNCVVRLLHYLSQK